jgi:hypothetical protein
MGGRRERGDRRRGVTYHPAVNGKGRTFLYVLVPPTT